MDIAQKLREEGYKVTPQRIAIYNVLYAENNHPTAEMIYQSLREDHPSMSLATVYKTMEIFERIGLVRVLDLGDDCSRYDWDIRNHPHVRCTMCNRINDLHDVQVNCLREEVARHSEYEITGLHVSFEGICPECLRKSSH
ncbi:Fur family transcriptional regulator [Veillonella sp. VA137]|uniref:Fur family transcriptional regulator n=1 Tax=Veillonella sp. VA137 TaxID=741828 RepID=UPI000F8C59D8|nr:Fur family transcriptional regulator [Veillonella sp. VA137]